MPLFGRAAAAGDQHERPPLVRPEIPLDGLAHRLLGGAVEVECDEAHAAELPVGIAELFVLHTCHIDPVDFVFLLCREGGRQEAGGSKGG